MDPKILYSGSFGPHFSGTATLVDGKDVQLSLSASSDIVEGSISVKLKSKAGLEALKKIIPGDVDNAVIDFIEEALKL